MFQVTCLDCGCAENMQNIQTNEGKTAIRVFPYVLACACGAFVAETPEGLRAARGDGQPSQGFVIECGECAHKEALTTGKDTKVTGIQIANEVSCDCGACARILTG